MIYLKFKLLVCTFLISLCYSFIHADNIDYSVASINEIKNQSNIELPNFPYNIHKQLYLSFSSNIKDFNSIRLGQRQPDLKGDYLWKYFLEINDSLIVLNGINRERDTTQFAKIKHNLIIKDTINVNVFIGSEMGDGVSSLNSHIRILTKGQVFDSPFNWYYGHNGAPYFESVETTGANGILKADCADFNRPVLILGDSYMSVSPARWPYYMRERGYFNFLMDALSGATAWDTGFEIERLKKFVKPSYILWFLGMNNPDPDDETVQSSWMYNLTNLKNYCDNNGIQLVIATIPNTPIRNHIAKNKWIRESSIRFVDFAKAVNATEKGANWTEGCLSADKVHPTALGSMALCDQILQDFPEIKYLAQESSCGDVNNDNLVDINDINLLINIILGQTDRLRFGNRADVSADDTIDISDVNTVLNTILGK